MKLFTLFAAACVLAASAHAAPSSFGQPLPAAANAAVRTSSYITMPDGTRLAADIYRPSKDGVALPGKFPVILHATAARTRLGDTDERSGTGRFSTQMINLASHGYVFVAVERRGIAASFGVRRGYHDRIEAQDSQDLIAWAARQPWSDGKVGGYGCSNTGDAAMHFLTLPSPHLKAVFAGCFNWDKYSGGMRGGVLANWGTGPQGSMERDMASTPVDGDENKVLLRQAAEQHAANTVMLDLWSGMPYRDSVSPLTGTAFWEEGSIGTYLKQVKANNIPVYVQGGWNDDFRAQGFIVLANLPTAKLVIGPWGHCDSGVGLKSLFARQVELAGIAHVGHAASQLGAEPCDLVDLPGVVHALSGRHRLEIDAGLHHHGDHAAPGAVQAVDEEGAARHRGARPARPAMRRAGRTDFPSRPS